MVETRLTTDNEEFRMFSLGGGGGVSSQQNQQTCVCSSLRLLSVLRTYNDMAYKSESHHPSNSTFLVCCEGGHLK